MKGWTNEDSKPRELINHIDEKLLGEEPRLGASDTGACEGPAGALSTGYHAPSLSWLVTLWKYFDNKLTL